jgi:hypothetical protein
MLFDKTDGESDRMRNGLKFALIAIVLMLVAAAMGGARAEPATVSFDPTEVDELGVGEQFTVDVLIADVSNLYGWQMNVTFNPSVLNAVRVAEGPFLKSVNKTMMPKTIDNSRGFVLAAATFVPPNPPAGATGSGILANITFSVKSGGGSNLHFDETLTYFRTVQGESVVPIEGVVKQDGTYGGGGGSGGIPWELVGGVVVVVVVIVVVGVFFLRRRRENA